MTLTKSVYNKLGINPEDVEFKKFNYQRLKKDKYIVLGDETYQMDLFFMYDEFIDKGYNCCLVLVNIGTRISDIEPMKGKTAAECWRAFKAIYDRKILQDIGVIISDNGSEFKNKHFMNFCNSHFISLVWTRPNQHRQNAIVEAINGQYKKYLNKFISYKFEKYYNNKPPGQKLNLAQVKKWTDFVYVIRDELNNYARENYPKIPNITSYYVDDSFKPKFNIGDIVHIKLDVPRNPITGKENRMGFRYGDLHYSREKYKIVGYKFASNFNQFRYTVDPVDHNNKPYGNFLQNELIKV